MADKKIIVIGSSNTDMVIKADRLPVPGETVIGGKFFMNPGGKGANQAVAAARLGGNVTVICKTGNDIFGKQSVELFNSEKINTSFVFPDSKNPSGVALITIDHNGENCIVVAPGANASLSPSDIEAARCEIEKGDIVLMQLEIPIETVEYATELASAKGIKVILNPAPARALSDKLLKSLHVITPNKTEAEILSGIKVFDSESAMRAAAVIKARGPKIVVITLGSQGALIYEQNTFHKVEAYKVEAIDTTAAGDTFSGALCVAISEGLSMVDAVKFASRASALAVTRMGAQSSIPFRSDLSVLV